MQNQNTKTNRSNIMQETWFQVLVFIIGTLILGFLASVAGGRMMGYMSLKRPPIAALPICFFVTRMIMYLMLGISMFLVWREPNRKKYNRTIDLICFYVQLLMVVFFPLFFFRLGSYIFATVWLGLSIVLAIVTLVRFWANNTAAGIMYTIYTIWLMYLFYVALGVCLLM